MGFLGNYGVFCLQLVRRVSWENAGEVFRVFTCVCVYTSPNGAAQCRRGRQGVESVDQVF